MFTRLLAHEGMRVLATDLLDTRLALASEFGATAVHNPGANRDGLATLVRRFTGNRGLDAAVIAVPSDPLVHEAQRLIRGGGQVLLFSHTRRGTETPLDLATVCVDEKSLIGSYSADFDLQRDVARLVFSRKIDMRRLISHQFPLEQTAAAIKLASQPTPDSMKIVVCPV
jgi:L-iditol 2-dehydrogenase